MTTTELMLQFSNPETLKTLSIGSKLMAGLVTTVMGMGITFIALILLQFIISWMERLASLGSQPAAAEATSSSATTRTISQTEEDDDLELTAVITAVLANHLHTTGDNIIIRNIIRIEDSSPLWNRAGILEQINSRL
jgi:glutaconyl-CoA/methylmalonyl-CoA decarboxylase subunit delta